MEEESDFSSTFLALPPRSPSDIKRSLSESPERNPRHDEAKSPIHSPRTPCASRTSSTVPGNISPSSPLGSTVEQSPNVTQRMDQEKALFPGSQEWAEDEERLFRILFLREYNPLLPRHWSMDFRGIPIPSLLFSQTDAETPVIYSRAGNDFKATRALIRLIDLTSTVRTLSQTGQGDKIAPLIRKELEEYAKWAAQDGGYDDLDIIPNLIVDSVDITAGSEEIEEYMQSCMQELAAKHRKYWRIERVADAEAWKLPFAEYPEVKVETTEPDGVQPIPEPGGNITAIKIEDGDKPLPCVEGVRYTQRPPVLYGIFVIHHSAIVLSMDSFKEGKAALVSYQVEAGFNVQYQGVWNAITMAIIICLARDHMVTMANDFVQLVGSPDSDPDA